MNESQSPALIFSNVSKAFDGKPVLQDLNFSLTRGCVKGLLGLNGAGKTTMIEAALGLEPVDGGAVLTLNENPASFSETTRAQIGYVPQDSELFDWMTARQMLNFLKPFYPRWNDGKVDALMKRWEVPENTLIGNLSGGQKQRLAIVRALAHEPSLLLLDEPVASLDPAGRRAFLKEVVDLTAEGQTTVLFSTHIVSDLERVASDVSILHRYGILLDESIDTLTGSVWRLVAEPTQKSWPAVRMLSERHIDGACVRVVIAEDSIQAACAAMSIRTERMNLEDLLIEVTA